MYKVIVIIGLLVISKPIFSQNIVKKQKDRSKTDSCLIFNNLIKKHWKYEVKGYYYNDSFGIITYLEKYPAFEKCLLRKNKKEIIKYLGKPSSQSKLFFYYELTPQTAKMKHKNTFRVQFNSNGISIEAVCFQADAS
jgi:hypothetical protein